MKNTLFGLLLSFVALPGAALAQEEHGWNEGGDEATQAPPSVDAPADPEPTPRPPSNDAYPMPATSASHPVYVETLDVPPPANTLTWAPLDLLVGTIRFEYEHALAQFLSVHVTAGALLFEGLGVTIPEGASYYALAGGLGARFFMLGHAPEGFWIGPRAQLAYANVKIDDASGSGVGYSAGGELGYTFLFGDAFVLSAGGGVAYYDIDAEATDGTTTVTAGTTGLAPTLRMNLGFAF